MISKGTVSTKNAARQMTVLMLSVLLVPVTQLDVYAQAAGGAYVELGADQLDQLVAPIALYPDSLVAMILTAATYPDQVGAADTWLNQNMGLPPDQRAAAANGMQWDPSVKGLVAFPSVLDNLARNSAWASQLGNAYYNQPGDVMNAVQAMRLQAQQSNRLASTPQQQVVEQGGVIQILPVNPAVVYVPYYNPWAVWGPMFVAYPGYVLLPPPPGIVLGVGLAFAAGIAIGVWGHWGWGFGAWAPAWGGGTIFFNHSTYISRSMTVYNHGYFGGHDRGVFEHGGRGVPRGFHAAAHPGAARAAAVRAGAGRGGAYAGRGGGPAGRGSAFANRGGAGASHGGAAGHGSAFANRGGAAAGHGGPAAGHGGAYAGRGGATPGHAGGAYAGRGGASAAGHGGATPGHGGPAMGRPASASRGGATAGHGGTSAARGGGASHGATAAHGSAHAAARPSGGGKAAGGRKK
jgi:hypothetical protein